MVELLKVKLTSTKILISFTKVKLTSTKILISFTKLKIISEVVLLLPKYWSPLPSWRLFQRLFYFYQNTDLLYQVEDYFRGCSTSTKYWPPLPSWRLFQRLFYFYQILTSFTKLKIISEVVLLLPNTDHLYLVEDYFRGCSTFTKYWPPLRSWRLLFLLCFIEVIFKLSFSCFFMVMKEIFCQNYYNLKWQLI